MRFLSFLMASTALLASPSLAYQSAPAAVQMATDDTIIVTGTRRSDRTVTDSTVPIDVIGAEALSRTGLTETARALRDLVPSFNFPQPSITDGTDVIRPATLRGLGPDQTLVLINGKRRHSSALVNLNGSVGRGSSAVDINLIPTSALSRVEVLRDGAAAQYGSDAIAGVINFQLNEARSGGRLTATYGGHIGSVEGVRRVTGVAQSSPGVARLAPDSTLLLENTGKDRRTNDGETLTIAGNIGLPLGADGFVNLTAEYRDRQPTDRSGYDPRLQYRTNFASGFDSREFGFDRLTHRYGDAKTSDLNLFVNAGIPVGTDIEAYAFASYGQRDGESAGFYRRANDSRNIVSIYPNGFLPLINTDIKDLAFTGGLKGESAGWNWDISSQYGRNSVDFRITNTLNASLGAASPTQFQAGGLEYSQWVNNIGLNRDVVVGGIDRMTVAAGLEYRRETFRLRPGEPDSYRAGPATVGQNNPLFTGDAGNAGAAPGSQVFPGFQPLIGGIDVTQQQARDNVSAYAELDADITSRWNIQVAGRFEQYSDFGSSWNGKLATRYAFADAIAIRGAVSTGFRAPSLQQQYFAASATNNIGGVLVDSVTLPVNNPVAIALGSKPLRPETAFNWSVGAVITPAPHLSLTIDYYQIKVDDRIVLSENLAATRDAAGNPAGGNPGQGVATILNNAGFRTISAARFFINGIDTRTRGVDVNASWRTDLGTAGKFGLIGGFNWNQTRITGRNSAPGALGQVPGINLFGRLESLRIERGQPDTKLNIGIDYDWQWLGVTVRANRYGNVLAPGNDAFNDVELRPRTIIDSEIRVQPLPGIELAIGANNLFDIYPTANPTGLGPDPATGATRNFSVNNYFLPFSSFSPFGFNGRFVYARASYRF
jgi:iron complex outermembrane recepter protein